MRFFLIDRVTELVPGERAEGIKNVTLTDEVLHDHFPDYPVLPGVLLVEAMAQLSGFLLEVTLNKDDAPVRRALLSQIEKARFSEPVWAGDQVLLRVSLERSMDAAAQVRGEAIVQGESRAKALLTFVMKDIPSERVHEQRRYLYRLWTRSMQNPPRIP